MFSQKRENISSKKRFSDGIQGKYIKKEIPPQIPSNYLSEKLLFLFKKSIFL